MKRISDLTPLMSSIYINVEAEGFLTTFDRETI